MTSEGKVGETKERENAPPDLTPNFALFPREKKNKPKCVLGPLLPLVEVEKAGMHRPGF